MEKDITEQVEKETLERNVDKTLSRKEGNYRKPLNSLSIGGVEAGFYFPSLLHPTFALSYYNSILNGFSSVFEWDNLPDGFNSSQFEEKLLSMGRLKVIKIGGKYLPVTISPHKWDYLGNVIKSLIVEPYLPKLTGKNAEQYNAIEIRNNNKGISIMRMIYPYLSMMDDATLNLEKHGRLIAGKFIYMSKDTINSDTTQLEIDLNAYMTNGKPVKVLNGTLLDNELPFRNIEVKDSVDSFIKIVKLAENKLLNVLGIPNNNQEDKKERLITDEVNIQNIMQSSILEDMLKWREKFVEEFNAKWGTNISVKLKSDIAEMGEQKGDNDE